MGTNIYYINQIIMNKYTHTHNTHTHTQGMIKVKNPPKAKTKSEHKVQKYDAKRVKLTNEITTAIQTKSLEYSKYYTDITSQLIDTGCLNMGPHTNSIVIICGAYGCGKSTLVEHLANYQFPNPNMMWKIDICTNEHIVSLNETIRDLIKKSSSTSNTFIMEIDIFSLNSILENISKLYENISVPTPNGTDTPEIKTNIIMLESNNLNVYKNKLISKIFRHLHWGLDTKSCLDILLELLESDFDTQSFYSAMIQTDTQFVMEGCENNGPEHTNIKQKLKIIGNELSRISQIVSHSEIPSDNDFDFAYTLAEMLVLHQNIARTHVNLYFNYTVHNIRI